MAKFYGNIGYLVPETEVRPGVWKSEIVERPYSGDMKKNYVRTQQTDQVNDNIIIANEISILADPYARENFHAMKYVEFMGTKWKISSVDASTYPRLILTLGGVYNGD